MSETTRDAREQRGASTRKPPVVALSAGSHAGIPRGRGGRLPGVPEYPKLRAGALLCLALATAVPTARADPPDNIDRAPRFALEPGGVVVVRYRITVRKRLAPRFVARMDQNGDRTITPAERQAFTAAEARRVARAVLLTVDGSPVSLTPGEPRIQFGAFRQSAARFAVDAQRPVTLEMTLRGALPKSQGETHIWEYIDRYYALVPGRRTASYRAGSFDVLPGGLAAINRGSLHGVRLTCRYIPDARPPGNETPSGDAPATTLLLDDSQQPSPGLVETDAPDSHGGAVAARLTPPASEKPRKATSTSPARDARDTGDSGGTWNILFLVGAVTAGGLAAFLALSSRRREASDSGDP